MPATKITDLLPIPPGTRQPHPYQVLGLADGEQDSSVIAAALQSVVSGLKAAKAGTDPNLWNQAARLVKDANKVLSNPESKAQLDARFGILSPDAIAEDRETSPADALAAFLPAADPLAKPSLTPATVPDPLAIMLPTANPLVPANSGESTDAVGTSTQPTQLPSFPALAIPDSVSGNAMPPGLFGTPATAEGTDPANGSVGVVVKAPRARRKKSVTGTVLFLMFAFGTFGVIGALVYFLIFGPGQVAIHTSDGKISISTQPAPNDTSTIVSQPRAVTPDRELPARDSIMGNLGSTDSSAGTTETNPTSGPTDSLPNELINDDLPASDAMPMELEMTPSANSDAPAEMLPDESTATPAPEMTPVASPETEMQPTEVATAAPDTTPEMEPLTDQMIAEAEQALNRVRQLIRSANWKEMKPSAEAILEQRMSEPQQQESQALFELADLASYYRVGIEKAVADLRVGNDFEVMEDFRVIVVETGPDLLVVRFNAANRSFSFDQLPWSLAHKLASFSMPNDPSAQAAKAVYQAISPNANEAYRQQALDWLNQIAGDVKGADTQRLAETIRSLFVES